jgi:prephenate dehydrogenase
VSAGLLVVGTGLLGTSVGLALRGDTDVLLHDCDPSAVATATARGAGRPWDGTEPADHVLLAVPPDVVAGELVRLQGVAAGRTWSHVCSVQAPVQAAATAAGADLASLCGTHPMAGKESSGPEAAGADLFLGRPWALCPSDQTTDEALAAARSLAERCGGVPLELPAREHDEAVALASHLPQVTASALAAVLLARSAGEEVRLAGPGLQDTSRIAASAPALWVEVLTQNAAAVGPLVRELATELDRAADALERLERGAIEDLLVRGNAGRALVPVKRGGHDRDFAVVGVTVPDRPGQIAGVLLAAADAGVNVEDVRVDHLPGRPSGVVELLVAADAREAARAHLAAAGWAVLP